MPQRILRLLHLSLGLACALQLSCNPPPLPEDEDGGTDGGTGGCANLQCRIVACQERGKSPTTLSGVVNIPAGDLPLYGATVYVPNAPLPPLPSGASCDRCDTRLPGSPVAQARTDANGRFELKDVPVGDSVPLVISLGKWRRQVVIPNVPACEETRLDPALTRLPRNQREGDLPRIALTTGGYDALECLLRKIGVDPAEFTPEADGGRVNLFAGHGGTNAYAPGVNNGARFTVATDSANQENGWWSRPANLLRYDLLLLSCEGQTFLSEKSATARQGLQDFINRGGRVFATHWHNGWISGGPAPLSSVARFYDAASAREFPQITARIDASFEKGVALLDWLANVGASMPRGSLPIREARSTVQSIDPKLTQRQIYYEDVDRGPLPQYFSFNAPVGAEPAQQCGRMVFTDIHVSGNDAGRPDPKLDLSSPALPFPNGCVSQGLTPQEKALIFLLFDLSGCVQPIIQ